MIWTLVSDMVMTPLTPICLIFSRFIREASLVSTRRRVMHLPIFSMLPAPPRFSTIFLAM